MYSKFVADLNVAISSISRLLTALNFGVGDEAGWWSSGWAGHLQGGSVLLVLPGEEIRNQRSQATAEMKSVSAVIFPFEARKKNNRLYLAYLKETTKSVQVNTI